MAKLHYALPALIGVLTLTACPGDDTGGSGTTSGGSGDTTTAADGGPATNTMTNVTTSASSTGPGVDSSGDDPTTSGTTNPPPTCDPPCLEGQSCINGNCIGDVPTTGQMCDMWGEGTYENCVTGPDMIDLGPCGLDFPAAICIVIDNPATQGVCAAAGCTDFCDCPQPPSGGTAECDAITMGGGNSCYLTCEGSAECPTDYYCFMGVLCIPGEDPNAGVPPYGDCVNPQAACDEGICIVDNTTTPTVGQCSSPCMALGDCPAPAQGGNPQCTDLTGQGNMYCSLSCQGGCPAGMECFLNALCVWPVMDPVEIGYGDCADPIPTDGCLASENCETNMAGTHSICTEPGCAAAMDCPEAADGNAVVSCGDPLMGGANTCYLDCSGGETCPTGQECVDNSYCAWAIGMAVFEEDFEGMNFPPMWNLVDVDGFMVNAMLGLMFPEAWIIFDDAGGGGTQAAASTSYYTMPQTADDWMITPMITIGANATLSWEARTVDAAFPDGYEVYVTNVGNQVADFSTMVFSVAAETETYSYHTVDLAAEGFASEDIWVAFRNNSTDGTLLLVDNIAVSQ